jgi:1,4-dihydroxy-6-naphthoate synthase
MYVNDYTIDYGPRGRKAVVELLQRGHRAGLIPGPIDVTFLSANP